MTVFFYSPADSGEPQQLTTIAEAVLMLLNSRTPASQWFLYPGWNPGTLVFVLERLFGLYSDDQEVPALTNLAPDSRLLCLLCPHHFIGQPSTQLRPRCPAS